jgi:hypothetical protein
MIGVPTASQTPESEPTVQATLTPLPMPPVPEATLNAVATLDAIRGDLEKKLPELKE